MRLTRSRPSLPSAKLEIFYARQAQEDLTYWRKHDKRVVAKIEKLIEAIQENHFTGLGKPEPLGFNWTGFWSRRITKEHRLVYKIHGDVLYIAQLRFHY